MFTLGPNTATLRSHTFLRNHKTFLADKTRSPQTARSLPLSRRGALGAGGLGLLTTVGVVGLGILGLASAARADIFPPLKAMMKDDPRVLTQQGMQKFRTNDMEGAVEDFDQVIRVSPSYKPYMWQRGLALYYLGRFDEGARQFRDDVAVNPNDSEEAVWAYLCEAQTVGPERARSNFLRVGRDRRPYMRAALEVFETGREPEKILQASNDEVQGGGAQFYSRLYYALFHESIGQMDVAKNSMLDAVATPYAEQSGDFMAALARVHSLRRGWSQ